MSLLAGHAGSPLSVMEALCGLRGVPGRPGRQADRRRSPVRGPRVIVLCGLGGVRKKTSVAVEYAYRQLVNGAGVVLHG